MRQFFNQYWWAVLCAVVIAAGTVFVYIHTSSKPLTTPVAVTPAPVKALEGGDGAPVLTASSTPAPVKPTPVVKAFTAHSFLVTTLADTDEQPLLYKASSARWPLASLTKIMTATIVLQHMTRDQLITTIAVPGAYVPSTKHLPIGATYRMDDLLHVMLIESSNEAAESFAAAYGRDAFLAAMNAQAAAWGMSNTHFDDPAGLSAGSQSTAADLLILARHVYNEYPEVFQTTRLRAITVQDASSTPYTADTTNEFAGQATFLGGKTGFTNEADGNLLSLVSIQGTPLVFIVLGSDDRFGDTRTLEGQVHLQKP